MNTLPEYPLRQRFLDRLARRLLPADAMAAWTMRREARAFDELLRHLRVSHRPMPLGAGPQGRVASCTWGDFARKGAAGTERARFFTLGYQLMNRFVRALTAAGFDLREIRSIYEFGCGTGRLIGLLRGVDGLRLVGSDLDAESVAWCQAQVPGPEFHVNAATPPLAFARDGEFDLVYAAAVLSCIHPDDLVPWIAEFARVVRPGGALLCTVLQEQFLEKHLANETPAVREEARARLRRDGHFIMDADHPSASATAKLTGTRDVFLTQERVDGLFRGTFDLRLRESLAGQDLLILRRHGGR